MFSSQQAGELDKISNCWGFNTIRVPVFLKGGYQQAHPSYDNYDNITNIINAYTQAGIVVIFEAHDKCRYGFLAKLSSRLN